jgi:hypothetical protein
VLLFHVAREPQPGCQWTKCPVKYCQKYHCGAPACKVALTINTEDCKNKEPRKQGMDSFPMNIQKDI